MHNTPVNIGDIHSARASTMRTKSPMIHLRFAQVVRNLTVAMTVLLAQITVTLMIATRYYGLSLRQQVNRINRLRERSDLLPHLRPYLRGSLTVRVEREFSPAPNLITRASILCSQSRQCPFGSIRSWVWAGIQESFSGTASKARPVLPTLPQNSDFRKSAVAVSWSDPAI